MFENSIYSDVWVDNLSEFLNWLERERRKNIPKGACGQDIMTTNGTRGLLRKYPTFEEAYEGYLKTFQEV